MILRPARARSSGRIMRGSSRPTKTSSPAVSSSPQPDYRVEKAAIGKRGRGIQQRQKGGIGSKREGSSRQNRPVIDGKRFFIKRARSHRRCERQAMIDKENQLSVKRQCEILDLNRSGIYYKPVPLSEADRELMRQIDEIHLNYPFYGSRNIRDERLRCRS